jgi:hypothetical protein
MDVKKEIKWKESGHEERKDHFVVWSWFLVRTVVIK